MADSEVGSLLAALQLDAPPVLCFERKGVADNLPPLAGRGGIRGVVGAVIVDDGKTPTAALQDHDWGRKASDVGFTVVQGTERAQGHPRRFGDEHAVTLRRVEPYARQQRIIDIQVDRLIAVPE